MNILEKKKKTDKHQVFLKYLQTLQKRKLSCPKGGALWLQADVSVRINQCDLHVSPAIPHH